MSILRTPVEIISEYEYFDHQENESLMQTLTSYLGDSVSSEEIKEKCYTKVIRFLTGDEAKEMVSERRKTWDDGITFEEARRFVAHLANEGYSDKNFAVLLCQAEIGCLEDPFHGIIRDMMDVKYRAN